MELLFQAILGSTTGAPALAGLHRTSLLANGIAYHADNTGAAGTQETTKPTNTTCDSRQPFALFSVE